MNFSEDMVSDSAQRIVDDVHSSYEKLRSAVTASIDDTVDANGSGGWSTKEMVAHVAFWEEAAVAVITGMFRGGDISEFAFGSGYIADPEDPWPVADVHNAREAQWARKQAVVSVMQRWEAAHAQLIDTLKTVTDQEATEHSDYFSELGEHLRGHVSELSGDAGATGH